jgi:glycosyltransferase 2 family protein
MRRPVGFTSGMVSREHLRRVAAIALELATARRVRVAAQLLLAAGLVFVGLRLHSIWHDSHVDLGEVDWWAAAGALVLAVGAVAATAAVWLLILRGLGVKTERRWAGIFFQAQLAKYIPGTVWQYAGRTGLARGRGIPLRPVAVSLPVEIAASIGAAGVVSLLVFGAWWIPAVLTLTAAPPLILRRASRNAVRAAAAVFPLNVGVWIAIGVSFWLTASALVHTPLHDLPVYVGAFTIAWLVGFVSVYAPGGIGVREAILVVLLRGRLGSADALVVAAAFRGVLTLVDLAAAGTGVLLVRRWRYDAADAVSGA